MSNRKMQEGLRHLYPGIGDEKFFQMIDATGGWPLGYQFCGFEHTEERNCGFTNSPYNDGWWTVVASSDDYYLWKLSPEAIARIADSVFSRAAASLRGVSRANFNIKNYRGYSAALTQAKDIKS